ncbi:MAG: PKD domain-containing protein [Marinilabiliales bacterium]|nr:PKD domain-containing protein [Marinilabiliales bacterium]
MTSDSCISFIEKTVISIPAPVAAFTYSSVTCESQDVQFTDQSLVNGGTNIVQWQWNFGDPASGINNLSTLQNPSHSFTSSGPFTVTLIVSNADNCRDTITDTLNVAMAPVADFTADTACLGSPTQFTDLSVPNAASIISYFWEFGDGATLNNQPDPVHTYATYGVFNVTLTITNSNGCIQSTTRQVVVNPLPVAAFSYSAPSCQGAPVDYTGPFNYSARIPWTDRTVDLRTSATERR